MNILLNTDENNSTTRIYIDELYVKLKSYFNVKKNCFDYHNFDIVIFVGFYLEPKKAKKINPNIKVILADPKPAHPLFDNACKYSDYLIACSIEQRDMLFQAHKNIYTYHTFPEYKKITKIHKKKNLITLAYHGNKVHIEVMEKNVIPAIIKLSEKININLVLIYNKNKLGKKKFKINHSNLKIEHWQWSKKNLIKQLNKCDIGIFSNELPINNYFKVLKESSYEDRRYHYDILDHIKRYKISTNPGRLYPYALAGLPVVGDFAPSSSQFIKDDESGFLCSSLISWFYSLEKLCRDHRLRAKFAKNLFIKIQSSKNKQDKDIVKFLKKIHNSKLNKTFIQKIDDDILIKKFDMSKKKNFYTKFFLQLKRFFIKNLDFKIK